jgi:hypothetical protein
MYSLEHHEDLSDRFCVMRKQEDSIYMKSDYLSQLNSIYLLNPLDNIPIDKECRYKMAMWFFQVVEYCDFNKEIASISMSYLDRFLSTKEGTLVLYDRRDFQLAAMVCLELAVKMNEPKELDMNVLSELSKGSYSLIELTKMEKNILSALNWRMCPLTASSFVSYLLELLPHNVPFSVKEKIEHFTWLQIELSIKDYCFVVYKPSIIALASIFNAIDLLNYFRLSPKVRQSFHGNIILLVGIDPTDFLSQEVGKKLKELVKSISIPNFNSLGDFHCVLSQKKNYHDIYPSSPKSVSGMIQS